PAFWSSSLLMLWIVTVSVFVAVYPPARGGRKIAYLTVASFVFSAIVLGIVLFGPSQHTRLRSHGPSLPVRPDAHGPAGGPFQFLVRATESGHTIPGR
ncbi:MAG TPA: hypothetical protein VIY86_10145, partial [Pirellulaceae bacterium]